MKAIEWLVKLVLTALITSAVCIASTFWAVSTYADLILTQYNLKSAVSAAPGWSQFVAHLGSTASGLFGQGTGGTGGQQAAGTNTVPADRSVAGAIDSSGGPADPLRPSETGAAGGSSTGTDASTNQGSGSSTGKKPPEDAVAVFGHQSGQESGSGISKDAVAGSGASSGAGSSAAEESKRIVVSGEEFTKKKDQLSGDEKNKIFNMLVTRVPQAEMQTISRLMEDGITAAELKQIEQLLQTYLKPEEYSQLLTMIKTTG
ncbi:hypothetical protein ACFQ88_26955 [Paenibacillus sp. NPDC056579]|uniref:hypothetical protein n=1 Tax=Paenibacillus sp. NPDC056579 TaxID=3345871 RepID=UPI0036883ACF